MEKKVSEKIRLHRKFRLLMQKLMRKYPPTDKKKEEQLKRQALNMLKRENQMLNEHFQKAKKSNRNNSWLQNNTTSNNLNRLYPAKVEKRVLNNKTCNKRLSRCVVEKRQLEDQIATIKQMLQRIRNQRW